MKISLNWLKELGDLPKLSAEEIGEKITLHTAELEEVLPQTPWFEHVYAGKLIEIAPHPDSDKLTIAQMDLGSLGKKQILFGKVHEVKIGEILPIAVGPCVLKSGAEVKDGEIRGIKTQGMIADNAELGMKNPGLIRFPADTKLGKSLPEICAEFGDTLFDIDNKSLTHRPDLMGHRGFSREYSAMFGLPKKSTDFSAAEKLIKAGSGEKLAVDIQTPHCRRFMGVKMSNVTIAPAPLETTVRLENLGTRSISNVVDVTNLVMLEWGQPMHAFDAKKIDGTIIVRQAKKGEKLVALDEIEYELTPDDIVIADEKKVLSIGGIMGGLDSSVTDSTTEIVFEAANFDPSVVRKTSARLGLRSESSMRFEKSLDPENCPNGIKQALAITNGFLPSAQVASVVADEYPQKPKSYSIELPLQQVRDLGGIEISDKDIERILTALEFGITKKSAEKLTVQVPSFRATKDIASAEDLIEEIVRLHGFENIPEQLPTLPIDPPRVNHLRQLEWKIRDFLAAKNCLEVYHTSFVAPTDLTWLEQKDHVKMLNATSEESTYLRQTLASNFLRHLENELRTHKAVQFFEIGKVYSQPTKERQKLGLVMAEIGGQGAALFYQLKQILDELGASLGLEPWQYQSLKKAHCLQHPHVSADISGNGQKIGEIFELFPTKNETKHSTAVYAEIDLETVLSMVDQESVLYKKLSDYPASTRDLSIVLAEKVLIADIESLAQKSANFLTKFELFDEYRDAQKLGKDVKNLAFHLSFQAQDRTLSHEEVEQEFDQILKALQKECRAELRVDFDAKKV